jgi:hypothetical protein
MANVVRLNDVTQAQTRHENYSGSVKMTFNKRRFADLTNEEVKKIVEDKDFLNTKKSTKLAEKLFRKYLFEKEIDAKFEYFDKETLAC